MRFGGGLEEVAGLSLSAKVSLLKKMDDGVVFQKDFSNKKVSNTSDGGVETY